MRDAKLRGAYVLDTPYDYGKAFLEQAEAYAQMVGEFGGFEGDDDELVIGLPARAWDAAKGYVESVLSKYALRVETPKDAFEIVTHTHFGRRVRIRRLG